MTRLRVAVDATSLYDVPTGIGRFCREILTHLADHPEVDLRAYAVTWRGRQDLATMLPRGVDAVRGAMAAAPLRALWRRADHPRIERWTGPVDVVHGPNYVVPPSRAARVVSVHDLTFIHHPEMSTADVLQYPALLRRAIAGGAWIHTDSEFVRGEVVDVLGADPARVVTVPLGVTPPASLDPDAGRALAGGDRYILALGTIEPRKNLPLLVQAFDELAAADDEIRLVIAGTDGWGLEQYERAVAAARHADRIVRVGYVAEAARGDLLAGAAVVAVPSVYEGFGLTAAEALRAGTPVVASSTGSHVEVVGDAGLLVPPNDLGALVDALTTVVADPEVAADLRRRGPARVGHLTWEATAIGVLALWQRASEDRGQRR